MSASEAFDASFVSPTPVKPDSWKNSDRPIPRFVPSRRDAAASEIRPLHRFAKHLQRARVAPEALTRGRRVARPQRVDLPDANRVDAELGGDAIHVHFGGELSLRRPEAPERSIRRRVGHRGPPADAHVVAPVRAARVNDAARQHNRAERRVRAAIEHGVDIDRGQPPVTGDARTMANNRRMPLRRREHVLDAVIQQLYGAPGLQGKQRRVTGDDGWVLFLAAKSAAVSVWTTLTSRQEGRGTPSAPDT